MRPSTTLTASIALLLIHSVTADFYIVQTGKIRDDQPLRLGIVPTNDASCDKQSTFTQDISWKKTGNNTDRTIENTNCQTDTVEHSEVLKFKHFRNIDGDHWVVDSTLGDIGVCVPISKSKGKGVKKTGRCQVAAGEWSYKTIYDCYSHRICSSSTAEKRWVA